MPRYTTSQTYTDGNTQIVSLGDSDARELALVTHSAEGQDLRQDTEDLEVKLRRITEQVPVRISNTSGSSAGSGSGDFHQYRQMRRREQDRLARMEVDYQKRKEEAEFLARREARIKAAEERTAKKRAKRQKKKEKKKLKKNKLDKSSCPSEVQGPTHLSEFSDESDSDDE
ncbi:hypothetical protein O6H91_21G017600 [Diphasiastrum complanatum]|uniref:Uncharacterized protein n=1 Tax=Diphasiastrum complanatum TaxID=34168 RepID=A0ACC2AIF3_DIPCM|nr:hypothetical protein O6H91_21G017600 [Diphasiastrum complanatum]